VLAADRRSRSGVSRTVATCGGFRSQVTSPAPMSVLLSRDGFKPDTALGYCRRGNPTSRAEERRMLKALQGFAAECVWLRWSASDAVLRYFRVAAEYAQVRPVAAVSGHNGVTSPKLSRCSYIARPRNRSSGSVHAHRCRCTVVGRVYVLCLRGDFSEVADRATRCGIHLYC